MSDPDDPTPGSSGISTPPSKKVRCNRKPFKKEWLKDSELKDWLKPDVNDKYAAFCSICDTKLKICNKSSLMHHMASVKHMKNYNANKSLMNIQTYNKTQESDSENEVAKAELLLTGYIAEHCVPFRQADHLVEVIKNMFPKYEPAQKLKLERTQAKICRKKFCSVIIDECTHNSISQVLAVMVRYFDEDIRKVTDSLLGMIEVEDATAEGLYKCVKDLLQENDIPLSNIIGFASDNCSAMLGANKGVQALLKKDVPSVFVMGCVCHSLALCCGEACKHLPTWLESFVKDVCCYFARGSKRQHDFLMIQDVVLVPKHRILKLSQTQWLSRGPVIARILDQWEALLLFFESESKTDEGDGAANIYKILVNSGTKHMLQFLNYIIPKSDKMNLEFQSEHFRLPTLFNTISDEYRSILATFVSDKVISSVDLADIDPRDNFVYKKTCDINLGGRCKASLIKDPLNKKEEIFRLDCRAFLVELCSQMRERFSFRKDSVLSLIKILDPKEALSPERKADAIVNLGICFPNLVKEEELDTLEDQWRDLLYSKDSLQNISENPTSFWLDIRRVTDGNHKPKFDLLSRFMCSLLALPLSSACVERVFSKLNITKTKQTNRLSATTASNSLLAKQAIARQDTPSHFGQHSKSLINDVKTGKCHKRLVEREEERHIGETTTLYAGAAADDSDSELDSETERE